jgi:hypothetical protein
MRVPPTGALAFALGAIMAFGVKGASAHAQGRTDTTHVRGDTVPRARRDTIPRRDTTARRDTLRADTTAKPLVKWVSDSDSVATALMSRPGFRATRYQGERVVFDAQSKALRIEGVPAAVGREQTLVIGDTVLYNDSTRIVTALGDTVVLHDPTQQSADVVARGRVSYNAETGRGIATNIATSVESGQRYYLSGAETAFTRDTSKSRASAFYVANGIITSCDDSIPDYYFKSNEIKYVSKHLIVARPATLYVAGVPVFWLPFLFQDVRNGRRSGLLTPRFGLSEFVRNSSSYRRHVENIGYYANLGDYMDAEGWLDWRSGARGTTGDPGYTRYNGQFRYRWLDRFVTGGISANHLDQRDGQTTTNVSWFHSQDFSATSRLYADINFSTNTFVQRQTTFNPQAVLATIRSDARYSRKIGPFSMDLGGSREQYPGRSQVLENYPSLTLTSPTLAVTKWLDWTPNFVYTRQGVRNSDQAGQFAYRYFTNASGAPDSSRVSGSTRNQNTSLSTPFTIKGFQVQASINETNTEQNYPVVRTFVDPTDTTKRITRTYARSYSNQADWQVGFSLPSFLPSTLKLSPSLTFTNVYGGSYWVQTELSRGQWVHQSKRPVAGVSITPTLFGLFPGIGPLTRIRHSITPTITYSYAPRADVPAAYLAALNQSPSNFLGSLAQNAMTLRLSQVFEGKLRSDTGATGEGQKVKLLAIDFTPLTWDFERARVTHRTGLTTNTFSYTLTSDLLPGFNFRSDYSLFQGNVQSDTARFKPYREGIGASFTVNGQSGVFAALQRLFGRAAPGSTAQMQSLNPSQNPDEAMLNRMSSMPVAGSYARDRQYQVPDVQTWTTTINFTSQRQRPPVGGRVITYDPATICNQYSPTGSVPNTVLFDQCRQNALLNPQTLIPINDPIAGGVFVKVPPRETIDAQSSFHITEKWSASWGTAYDLVHRQFASQQVSLQRDLHDWRALFSFSQSPNGNFYFSFFIVNKAQPDLKFNYDKPTYRQPDLR